jgi:C_GCAxxG_C_C family probable redox protein
VRASRLRSEAGPAFAGERATRARARTRELFLDGANSFGCAETTYVVLKEAFGLPDADDRSAAMALNGGVGYGGGTCGAITGAALAIGELAGRRFVDQRAAKRRATFAVGRTVGEFEARFGATDCRTLIGREIRTPDQHRAFIAAGEWRTTCMAQIESVVEALADLGDEPGWSQPGSSSPARSRRRVDSSSPRPSAT